MANNLIPTSSNERFDEKADDSAVPGYVPEGYKTVEEFLQHVRDEFTADESYDSENRKWALDDLKFIAGDQWDDEVAKFRKDKGRPCLTINVLPQFVGQVMGDRRMNKTNIKVRPVKDATMELADVRSAIIKGIEAASRAERVYDACCEDQVSCGISNMRVDMEYAGNDVFEQDIIIRHIPNPLAVIWDRLSVDPTGRDARHCFVQDILPRKVYDKKFPDHPCPAELGDNMTSQVMSQGWFDKDVVRITEFWELVDKPATFALMADGDVKDVTGMDPAEYEAQLWRDPNTGKTKIRKSFRTYARMHLVTGFALLSEGYEIPLTRLPIIKVEGRVVRVGDDRVRYGLIRYAKDSQRLKNYWRSVAAETLAMAPKAQWIAPEDAVEDLEDEFRSAHLSGDPLLKYRKNATGKPERVDPPAIPAALLNEAQMNQQDIKDTTGLHDASLGIRSNEVSGRAIQARKVEGDVATVIYHDNLNHSIQECGDVINQLIPLAYDTPRTLRAIGPDDKHDLIRVNDPFDENSPDITKGKYDVQLETGPSFTSQRQEALEAMMTLIQTSPDLMQVIGDLVAKNMDWPGAHEISERLRKIVPKELLSEDETGEGGEEQQGPTPEQQTMQAQMQMQMAQMQDAQAQLEHAAQMRQIELAEAQARLLQAQAATEQANASAEQAKANAVAAQAKAQQALVEAEMAPQIARHKMALAERATSARMQPANGSAGSRPAGERPKGAEKGKK